MDLRVVVFERVGPVWGDLSRRWLNTCSYTIWCGVSTYHIDMTRQTDSGVAAAFEIGEDIEALWVWVGREVLLFDLEALALEVLDEKVCDFCFIAGYGLDGADVPVEGYHWFV